MVYCCGHQLADDVRRAKEDELSLFDALDQVPANHLTCERGFTHRRPDRPHETFARRGNLC